jgi:putative peptidoglycan lipid II flippase
MENALHSWRAQWKKWTQRSTHSPVLTAALSIGGLTLVAKVLALGKDLVIAHEFGVSSKLDAYLLVFALLSFVTQVVAGGFPAALIPTYIQVREQAGSAVASRVFSGAMSLALILLVAVSLALTVLVPVLILPLVGSAFNASTLRLSQSLFFVLLPLVILNGLALLWGALLNAGERFAVVVAAPILLPLVSLVFLVLTVEAWDIYAVAAGTLAGVMLQVAALAVYLKRTGVWCWPRWYGKHPALRQTIHQYLPALAGALVIGGAALVDQFLAATLGEGNVSALNYANKIVGLLLMMGSAGLGTAVLPHFSRLVAQEDWRSLHQTFRFYSRLVLAATAVLTLALIIVSEPVIRLLYQRGVFTAEDTQLVSRIQVFYLLQVPFYYLGILNVRLAAAYKANSLLLWTASVNLVVNVTLDVVLMRWLGVAGIALSSAGAYLTSFAFTRFILYRRFHTPLL